MTEVLAFAKRKPLDDVILKAFTPEGSCGVGEIVNF